MKNMMALGAAQLGMAYGVANKNGDLSQSQASSVLSEASRLSVPYIDTAASYGESENRIGYYLRQNPDSGFKVISKLHADVDPRSASSVANSVTQTCQRLGRSPWGMFVHNPSHIYQWGNGLGASMEALKLAGRFENIGVSVYTPEEFRRVLEIVEINCIQAPINVFDRRIAAEGLIERARAAGKTLFLRSVFLQGLLLMTEEEVTRRFGRESPFSIWSRKWWLTVSEIGRPAAETAIGFARSAAPDGLLVLGCESRVQVVDNVEMLQRLETNPLSAEQLSMLSQFTEVPPEVYDPRLWPNN